MSRNRAYCAGALMLCIAVAGARSGAQELEMSISPSPVGSGARAAGMADAFVAIADDATAASWNPAGLVQLERPEISVVGSYTGISEAFRADPSGFNSEHRAGNYDLNYLSLVIPSPRPLFGHNVSFALNYQRKYDFSREFDVHYSMGTIALGGAARLDGYTWEFRQEGGLSTITPAIAIEITPRLSLGVALNLWRSSPLNENRWKQEVRRRTHTLFGPITKIANGGYVETYEDVRGENATLGVLWNVTDKWNLAARYDTRFSAHADYKRRAIQTKTQFPSLEPPFRSTRVNERRKVAFPSSVAIGSAYRFSDRFTLSADVTRTDWDHFYTEDALGRKTSLVDGSALDVLGARAWPFKRPDFDATYTVRLGTEYVFIPKEPRETLKRLWSLRGGLFYDQEPAQGHPDSFYGGALGLGLLLSQRVNIDLAYQARFGDDVNAGYIRGISGFTEDVLQHRVLLSTVVYF